jgi:uncharacterized protein
LKKINLSVIQFILATGIIFFGVAGLSSDNPHLILVNGIAERSIDPNMTILQIEAWGKATTAKNAQDIQANLFQKIKTVTEKFKVKKEDLKTENFSVAPDYVYDQKAQVNRIVGYRVSHQVSVIYRKTDDAGALVDALTAVSKADGGGITIQSISWDYDKRSVIEASAVGDAVRSARAKAEDLAKAASTKIKAVHRIQYSSGSVSSPVRPMNEMSLKSMDSAASTELSSGQVKVRVEVQMEFEI